MNFILQLLPNARDAMTEVLSSNTMLTGTYVHLDIHIIYRVYQKYYCTLSVVAKQGNVECCRERENVQCFLKHYLNRHHEQV